MKHLLFIFLLCLLGCFVSHAQFQGLDPTFATNGIYVGDTGGFAKIVVQPDKKIIVTGQEIISGTYTNVIKRFNEDGTLDNSFAINGCFRPNALGFRYAYIMAICLQPDGKILLGGSADTGITATDFFLIRLKLDGSFDSSFGGAGYVMSSHIHPFTPAVPESVLSIALQTDGKVVAYGYIDFVADTLQVRRYHPDGRIDSSFGVNGQAKLIKDFDYPKPNDIAIATDGKIIVGATTKIDILGTTAFTAIRLLPDGRLDTSFNHTGIAYASLSGINYCKAMCLQPDNKIILAGYADSLALIRFDTLGQLDNSFGNGGVFKIAGGSTIGNNVTAHLNSNGKILVAGQIGASNYLFRRDNDGSPDNSFGINGEEILYGYSVGSIFTQQDGRILISGFFTLKASLARLTPNATDIKDTEFGSNIRIYPNPAKDQIIIDNKTGKTIRHITLYSPEGKLILSRTYPHTDRLITEGLSNGMYLLRLQFDNQPAITRTLLIQKN